MKLQNVGGICHKRGNSQLPSVWSLSNETPAGYLRLEQESLHRQNRKLYRIRIYSVARCFQVLLVSSVGVEALSQTVGLVGMFVSQNLQVLVDFL